MSDITFTFTVDDSLKAAFSAAAMAMNRSEEELLQDYMQAFVQERCSSGDDDAWYCQQIQAGLDESAAGELVSAEEVEAEAEVWRAEVRGRISSAGS